VRECIRYPIEYVGELHSSRTHSDDRLFVGMVSTSALNSKIASRLSKDHEQATSVVEFVEGQGRGGRLQIRGDAIHYLLGSLKDDRTRTVPGSLTNIRMYDA
jgi:hypothetical protein